MLTSALSASPSSYLKPLAHFPLFAYEKVSAVLKPDNNLCTILSPSAFGRGWWRLLMSLVLPGNQCVIPVGGVWLPQRWDVVDSVVCSLETRSRLRLSLRSGREITVRFLHVLIFMENSQTVKEEPWKQHYLTEWKPCLRLILRLNLYVTSNVRLF